MKVLLKLVLSSFLFVAVNASAESYTLRNNNTGSVFTCSAGGATTPVNPQCISELNDYCDYETNYSNEECFSKSTRACVSQVSVSCVKEVNDDCDYETNYSNEKCFDESVLACGGNAQSLRALMQASREKAVADARASFPK
jgi:hypothetical protein